MARQRNLPSWTGRRGAASEASPSSEEDRHMYWKRLTAGALAAVGLCLASSPARADDTPRNDFGSSLMTLDLRGRDNAPRNDFGSSLMTLDLRGQEDADLDDVGYRGHYY